MSKGCNTHLCIHKRFANENKAYQSYAKISSSQPTNGTFTTSKKTTPAVGDVALLSYDAPKIKVMDDSGLKELVVENATGVSFHSGLVKQKICALLEKAKNNVLVAEDIINAFRGNESRFTRRWFNRLFAQLEAKGFTERVHIARGGFSATTEDQGEEDGSRRFFRCVRLLKPYDATLAGPTDLKNPASKTYAAKMAEEDTDVGVIVGEGKVLCEMTLEWQIFRLICLSGSSGVIAQTLKRSLNNIGTKILGRAIDRIMKADSSSKSLGITRVHESVGRERRYRYFASKKALAQMSSSLKPNLKSVAAVAPVHLLQVIPKPAPSSNQSVELPTPAPSSVSVSIENSPEKSAKAAQKRIIPVSVGNLQRRNHILELLEEEKVLEMGMGLVKSYEALLEKQGIKTAFRVDKKTVVRTCNSLASDGLASVHVVQVPLLNGNYATRSFLLHKSLAADDTFVREFIQNVSERNLLYYPNIQKTKRLYEDGIEIDRVTAKKTRPTSQQEHLDEPAVCEERNSSSVLADNLISSVVPLESVQFLDIPRDTVASTYGYIRTRIVRARLFHEWLFSIMKGENDGAPYKNMGVFTTSTIFMDMPLELFLKIVGIRQITAEMKEFLDDPKNRELPISKLPSGTKFLALRKNSRLKQKLHEILDILMYLHAVLPVEAPEMAEQANRSDRYSIRLTPSYQMVSRVPFYDLVLDVQTLIRFFDVTSKNTLDEFWLSIHSVLSSKPAGEKAHLVSEDVESEEDGIIEPHRSARNVPLHLSLAENWLHQPTFTPEQIRQLDSYVNRISGTTPLAYPQECAIIARELDIPVSRVQIYFKAIEDTVKRKELIKQQRARAKRLNRAILDAGSSVKLRGIRPAAATTPKKDKNERRGRPKRTIERPGRKTISGQMNQAAAEFVERSGEQLPVVVNVAAFNDVFTKVAARRRGNWTSEERENLVLAHAIVTYFRDPVNRIYMAPLSRVINDRPIRSVAKHIETFMKDPVQVKRHDRFIAIWREIHGEGLAEKAYNSDTNIQTMELSKMLEYLKTKAASDRYTLFPVNLIF